MMRETPFVEMTGIDKAFSGNKVLHGVNMTVNKGEVHALMGENGAGKSTLIKVLCGVHHCDAGGVKIENEPVQFKAPKDAEERGINIVH